MTAHRVSRLHRVSTASRDAVSVTASRVSPPSLGETQTRTHSAVQHGPSTIESSDRVSPTKGQTMNPSLHQIRALLDSVQPDIATAIIDRLNGHPRAQAYDGDRTTRSRELVHDAVRHRREQRP